MVNRSYYGYACIITLNGFLIWLFSPRKHQNQKKICINTDAFIFCFITILSKINGDEYSQKNDENKNYMYIITVCIPAKYITTVRNLTLF